MQKNKRRKGNLGILARESKRGGENGGNGTQANGDKERLPRVPARSRVADDSGPRKRPVKKGSEVEDFSDIMKTCGDRPGRDSCDAGSKGTARIGGLP